MPRSRRDILTWGLLAAARGAAPGVLFAPNEALGFGDEGAFHPRLLQTGEADSVSEQARRAASRWSLELMRRTSAPSRLAVDVVYPSSAKLLEEPTLVWEGARPVEPLSNAAIRHLRTYLRMGGILIVDDRAPQSGTFSVSVKRELKRVLPDSSPIILSSKHVIYKTFYLMEGPAGRVAGPAHLEAIVAKKAVRVLFLRHDLLGALARTEDGQGWAFPMEVGGAVQREHAVRLAVNIAMYVLCSDYKDDQVHAPYLMRRRHRER